MAQRDLTFNAPRRQVSSEEEGDARNPFTGPNEVDESSFESQQRSSATSSEEDDINREYGRPFNAYNGYYAQHDGTTSKLLSNDNSSSEDPLAGSNSGSIPPPPPRTSKHTYAAMGYASTPTNQINVPSEFDRYPSMAGSRVVSSTSLNNLAAGAPAGAGAASTQHKSDGESSISSNPFSNGTDFSPFGGYPASSFPLHIDEKEPDDYLHNPDPIADANYDKNRFMADLKNIDKRSLGGLIGLVVLLIAAIVVFILLPVLTYSGVTSPHKPESYEILTHYKYPLLSAIRTSLVDPDTPTDARTAKARDGSTWDLVFSDEFNIEGRTFYEGDDQFFTAPDLHYDATHDLEWYDPDAVTTSKGTLNLRMDAYKNHNLFYRSGMVQSWNKFCFTEGKIDIAARLPNYGGFSGLWPGLWTMGNLGRPGYLATTEGVWPYSYDACDAGITPNQSSPDGISYLPGQRLNSCTCKGESHPNPGKGRGAPEIDVIEAEADTAINNGVASQSLQLAPFDIWYYPDYDWLEIYNLSVTTMNTYTGGPFQQALSATTTLNITWYERGNVAHNFQSYGFEYLNDDTNGYLRWFVGQDPTLTVHANALHPNGNIDWRRLSKEPMSIIMNLGISNNWAYINWPSLHFPVEFRIDYVRVYQPQGKVQVGCDPQDYPTYDYIQQHLNIYENVNLTSFEDAGYKFPKNRLLGC
ncbi:glycoside hydrolase family 16 protein [Suhomyces tanzawaensis NRRL Y-17324]|uniref:Glycoside hydrolase family 16 protein n=1 Tax=Suhomyces tanzawaensis NRRL Y-17324 TaxID=984487 RepID=A0A1E4SI66_9ASCO|nr:glycoside hydrolase family 16 protein [Suhomyces tanzawaensis NRRL Y-17324]ODV79209.1 glycoside hydrolase family 16 protein [Suhomyces tanzawaensis NRRL Y-17324]